MCGFKVSLLQVKGHVPQCSIVGGANGIRLMLMASVKTANVLYSETIQ